MDAWKLESLQPEWWYACRLPVNWKIAEEAFLEQYHVLESHPQLRIPGRMPPRGGKAFDPQVWLDRPGAPKPAEGQVAAGPAEHGPVGIHGVVFAPVAPNFH